MKKKKGRNRKPLTTKKIAITAIQIADMEGLEALSMRKIAEKLGVEAMSLYHHVPSKEKLMEAMVEELIGQLPEVNRDQHWRACLTEAALSWRKLAKTHPGTFPLLATRAQTPPELIERYAKILKILRIAGIAPTAGVMALNSFFVGLNGFLLAAGEPIVFREIPEPVSFPVLSSEAMSEFANVSPHVWEFSSDTIFMHHLEFLLEGMASTLKF